MDIIKFYEDFHLEYKTQGHKHCRPGWVNRPCPFCTGHGGNHLGFEIEKNMFVCWRCGYHPTIETIQKLTGVTKSEAYKILQRYGGTAKNYFSPITKVRKKAFRYPTNGQDLLKHHKKYLESRNFDPDYLEHEYGIFSTGPVSSLKNEEGKKIDFKNRIIIPIEYQNKVVSFTSRAIKSKKGIKYLSCPKVREIIEHKTILYGIDKCKKKSVIVVEGPTDKWRMGIDSVATFGIKWKLSQVKLLANTFDRIFILYDDDPQAIEQAIALKMELEFRGKEVVIIDIVGDPGGMKQSDANHLIKELIR